MKNYLLIGVVLLLLISCNNNKYKNTTVYLKLIKEIPKDSVVDLSNYIQFSDNRENNKSELVKPSEFTSIVNPGKKVKWKSANGSIEKIKIIEILFKDMKGNVDILEDTVLKSDPDEVERKVKETGVDNKSQEHYSIVFSINKVKDTIDPVLEYHK